MGNKCSKMYDVCFKPEREMRVGLLGLDNAGKTTILYQLKLKYDVELMPTVGFNVELVHFKKSTLNIWDISGTQPKTRIIWQHYNQNTRAIIFVVDAADIRRIPRAAAELQWIINLKELTKAVVLIYANKQDIENALSAGELIILLHLQSIIQPWAIQECCALTGRGLWEGLYQLETMLTANNFR